MSDAATLAASQETKSAAISRIVLRAQDPDWLAAWYKDVLCLDVREPTGDERLLDIGSDAALMLLPLDEPRPRDPRSAGLYHTAFLLPDRARLAQWLKHALDRGVRILGASDHNVSEAIYLADPEGNGIEVYADLPRAGWFDADGNLVIRSTALDVDRLLSEVPAKAWTGALEGMTIGHIHLQVGETAIAEAFYHGILGLDIMSRYSDGTFYGSGGYHHRLATNAWKSRGATATDPRAPGIAAYAMTFGSMGEVDAIRRRAVAAGLPVETLPMGLAVHDPWGIKVTVLGLA